MMMMNKFRVENSSIILIFNTIPERNMTTVTRRAFKRWILTLPPAITKQHIWLILASYPTASGYTPHVIGHVEQPLNEESSMLLPYIVFLWICWDGLLMACWFDIEWPSCQMWCFYPISPRALLKITNIEPKFYTWKTFFLHGVFGRMLSVNCSCRMVLCF